MYILEKSYIQQLFKIVEKLGSVDMNSVEQTILFDKLEKEIYKVFSIEITR